MNKNEEVIQYYEKSHVDYFFVYFQGRSRGMNYGYWDAKVKGREQAFYRLYEHIQEQVGIKSSDKVLDAGCGFGDAAFWFARNTGCNVTGVSITPEQVTGATTFAKELHLDSQVEFKEMDYTKTTFADKTFDKIYALETICHLYDKKPFYEEMLRILKPGGTLIVADYDLKKEHMSEKESYYMKEFIDGWALGELWSTEKYKQGLSAAGFVDIKTEDYTNYTMKNSHFLYIRSLIGVPLYTILNKLGLITTVRLQNCRASYYQWLARKDGLWGHVLTIAKKPV